ncbi:MAG: phosphatase PAP2 family protein [Gordonia sp. (in: high G+C Gram-positive bacteria)]|uniref:phosphatase PAP2 family protein n=1 Tax=Gordonia sp. (in: high G+C Gram-positive bacteria) TaxID=84139 RepID=UPI0039E4674C
MSTQRIRVAVGASLLVLAGIGGVVFAAHPGPIGIDSSWLHFVAGHRNVHVTEFAKLITDVFSPVLMLLAAVVVGAVVAFLDRTLLRGVQIAGAAVAAFVIAEVLKVAVDRPRPPAAVQLAHHDSSASYTSGHVTGTTALIVVVLLVVVPWLPRLWADAAWVSGVVVIAAIMWSRTYLGMHWLTDTVGAVLVGTGSALVVTSAVESAPVDRWLRRSLSSPVRTVT